MNFRGAAKSVVFRERKGGFLNLLEEPLALSFHRMLFPGVLTYALHPPNRQTLK